MIVAGEITIKNGPGNATVSEGQSLYMCCECEGTRDLPVWRINRTAHLSTNLPLNHMYTTLGLYIQNVQVVLNNTEYLCLFLDQHGGRIITVESLPAILIVKSNTERQDNIVYCVSQTEIGESTNVTTEQTQQPTINPAVIACVLIGESFVVIAVIVLILVFALLSIRRTTSKLTLE